jgi:hypothetical protein
VNLASWVLIGLAAITVPVMFSPGLRRSRPWRATVTPLASIIGSGFLLAGPILGATVGSYAIPAMAGLIFVGYLFGEAIRFNIAHVEPSLKTDAPRSIAFLDEISDVALALAYFVSIAYYINLFSAFFLSIFGITSTTDINVVTTVMIIVIGLVGVVWGFRGLEKLIIHSVSLKLGLIAALVVALGVAAFLSPAGASTLMSTSTQVGTDQMRVVLGLLILVQGFETSRYLGDEFDGPTRIRSMRLAQLLSAGIYLVFIAAITPHFGALDTTDLTETSVIGMLSVVGAAFAPVLIVAALASQFSASIADTSGAAGLLVETTRTRLNHRLSVLLITAVVIGLTWSVGIFQIVTLGSQAFVIYYILQASVATAQAIRMEKLIRAVLFALVGIVGLAVLVFAVPAG